VGIDTLPTLLDWEQGRAKPTGAARQIATLGIASLNPAYVLAARFQDTISRLEAVSDGSEARRGRCLCRLGGAQREMPHGCGVYGAEDADPAFA